MNTTLSYKYYRIKNIIFKMIHPIKTITILCLLLILLFVVNVNAQSKDDFLKSFPVWGGTFSGKLDHFTYWIQGKNKIIKTVSWEEKSVLTKVPLKDTEWADYDESRDDKFYYRGQIIDPTRNLDLKTRSFTYYKRQNFIYLNQIDPKENKFTNDIIFFIDNAEFIYIYNIKIYKNKNGEEYVFIYLQSGEEGLETGIYCYKMLDILSQHLLSDSTNKEFKHIPYIHIPIQFKIYENWSITEDINNPNNIIITAVVKKSRKKTVISNFFLDFYNKKYIEKELLTFKYLGSTPKIIHNKKYKFLYYKKPVQKNRSYIVFAQLNDSYDKIIKEYQTKEYELYKIPRSSGLNFINRDIGLQAEWIDEENIIISAVVTAHTGNEIRSAGTDLILVKFDILKSIFEKITLVKEKERYLYFNSSINYNPDNKLLEITWLIEGDVNRNGYPDRDAFLTYGYIDKNTKFENTPEFTSKTFKTVNLSFNPRSVWSPQLIKDKNGTNHYLWLQQHPKYGYQVYYRNDIENKLCSIIENLNLPLYGDNTETIFTLIFYFIISIGLGIFEGTILNGVILLLLFAIVIFLYKMIPHITDTINTLILLISAIIILIVYGIPPFSNAISLPNFYLIIIGFILCIILLLILDKVLYRKKIHTPTETCVKIWFFSMMFSIYLAYSYISVFIVNDMIIY